MTSDESMGLLRNNSMDETSDSNVKSSVTLNPLTVLNDSDLSNANQTWDLDVCSVSSNDFLSSSIFLTCVYTMYFIVFIIAFLGNGLVIYTVGSTPNMKTVTNYFITNLAIGDILMTLFCVPFTFVSMLVLKYWPFGAVMCKIVNYAQAVSVFVSAYTLLAISIDRYKMIMRPLRARLGKSQARMVVAAVWVGALATAAPIPVVSQLQKPTDWHLYCEFDVCLEDWKSPQRSQQYTCALLVLQFGLPLSALVCTYARIAVAVWGGRAPGEAQSERDARMHRSKRKMVKMMVTVVAVFIVCWLPLNMFILLWTFHGQDERWASWPGAPYVWFVSHWLAMAHCCCNPVIYCYMNAHYRRGFAQTLRGLFHMRYQTAVPRSTNMCEGMPMSDTVGRRVSRGSCCLHRGPTRSTTVSASSRRHRAHDITERTQFV